MHSLHTIGYEGTSIDAFIDTLRTAGVAVLADVRAVALSRKPGFSKKRLQARLESEGIRYVHFIDLGDPKPGREAARQGRMSTFRTIYSEHLASQPALEALDALSHIAENEQVCLLCFERDPATCHRMMVADSVHGRLGLPVTHLFVGGGSLAVGNGPVRAGRDARQGVAAA